MINTDGLKVLFRAKLRQQLASVSVFVRNDYDTTFEDVRQVAIGDGYLWITCKVSGEPSNTTAFNLDGIDFRIKEMEK